MVIRRIVPISAAKVMAIIYAFIGLLIGVVIFLISRMGGFPSDAAGDATFGSGYGVAAIIVLPLVYGAVGFVAMLVMTSLYNWAAGIVGGIEILTGEETPPRA